MNSKLRIYLVFILSFFMLFDQEMSAQDKPIPYEIWIKQYEPKYVQHGYLQNLNDSTITLQSNKRKNAKEKVFAVNNINSIKIRDVHKKRKGIIRGTLVGLIIGMSTGLILGNREPCQGKCLQYLTTTKGDKMILFSIIGSGLGWELGGEFTKKTTIPVRGDWQKIE